MIKLFLTENLRLYKVQITLIKLKKMKIILEQTPNNDSLKNQSPAEILSNIEIGKSFSNDYKKLPMQESVKANELYVPKDNGDYEVKYSNYIPGVNNESKEIKSNEIGIVIFVFIIVIIIIIFFKKNIFKKNSNQNNIKNSLNSLIDLRNKGIISEEEYLVKTTKIFEEEKIEQKINSVEYKQLKSLYENGILTKKEFESKVDLIKL